MSEVASCSLAGRGESAEVSLAELTPVELACTGEMTRQSWRVMF